MSEKKQEESCCNVEGVVNLDSRGQIVIPKTLREKMNLKEGDKLVVISMNDKGKIASISLMKSDRFDGMVKLSLRPIMKEIIED